MTKRVESRAFIQDIKGSLSDRQLMKKYGVSAVELFSLLLQAVDMGLVNPSELCAASWVTCCPVQLEESRATRRCYVDSGLAIYEPHSRTQGIVLDISERGFQVRGLRARVEGTQDFEIVAASGSPSDSVHVVAECRWIDPRPILEDWKAGFEVVAVTAGSLKHLCEDLSPVAFASSSEKVAPCSPDIHEESGKPKVSRGLVARTAHRFGSGSSDRESAYRNALTADATPPSFTLSLSERTGGDEGPVKRAAVANIVSLKDRSLAVSGSSCSASMASGNLAMACGIDEADYIVEGLGNNWTQPESDSQSKAMQDALKKCRIAARSDVTILLHGETGSGKDYLAAYIHRHSNRAAAPYRSFNCSAIPQDLAESELFGHEAGAFTGAGSRKKGMLALAPGGTLLLNEVGELPLMVQAKLLTFLDTRGFLPVGGQIETHVDARIVAATNRNLDEEVSTGRFRQDLFHRLNVLPIPVPPLRERIEDIPFLIPKLVANITQELKLNQTITVDQKTLRLLQAYDWPGNVRELRNRIERSLVLSGGRKISFSLMFDRSQDSKWSLNMEFGPQHNFNEFIHETRHRLVVEALKRAQGNRQEAAKLLGLTRYSLKRHMTSLGLMSERGDGN